MILGMQIKRGKWEKNQISSLLPYPIYINDVGRRIPNEVTLNKSHSITLFSLVHFLFFKISNPFIC